MKGIEFKFFKEKECLKKIHGRFQKTLEDLAEEHDNPTFDLGWVLDELNREINREKLTAKQRSTVKSFRDMYVGILIGAKDIRAANYFADIVCEKYRF